MGLYEKDIYKEIKQLNKCLSSNPSSETSLTISNQHAEVLDTGTRTLTGVSNYSYTVLSGSAEVLINGVTISGVPAGFDARQGESTASTLSNDITITGESLGTRVIIYYEIVV